MAEQILSQEEIDALLNAMDTGDVDTHGEKTEVEAKPYDLASRGISLNSQYDALEEVYDNFAILCRNSLSSSLQKPIELKMVSTEMLKFGEFLQAFSNPTGFITFNMEPLIGHGLMVVEPSLVFSLIDCMFGGSGKTLDNIREFTLIEQRMLNKFSKEVLVNLEKAWETAYSVNISLKKLETKPEYIHLAGTNDLMIVLIFSLTSDEFSGNIHFCFSSLMFEPIKEKLSSRYLREKDMVYAFSSQIKALLQDTPVKITAELGRTVYSVRQVLQMHKNDVLSLKTGPEEPITINIEEIPKYQGFPGVTKGNRAIQITSLINQNGGE